MILMSAVNILVKSLSVVLIGMLGAKWAIAYVTADVGLFLAIKVARGDFYYWIPLEGWTSIVVSFILRIAMKAVVDFTSLGKMMTQAWHKNKILPCRAWLHS